MSVYDYSKRVRAEHSRMAEPDKRARLQHTVSSTAGMERRKGRGMMRLAFALAALVLACLLVASTAPTVDPLRVYEVRQIVAAEDALTAALIACGPDHASVVCDVVEVTQ